MTSIALPGLVHPHDLSSDRQFSMTLARGLEVLRAFTASHPMLSNREISDRTGLPKPTVSRLTYTLGLLGYMSKDAATQKYRLASGVLSLGHPLLASMKSRQVAKPLMAHLAQRTECTVNLGLRDRADIVYVDSVRADGRNEHLPDIGSTYPLLASAMGRALILSMPQSQRSDLLNYLKLHDKDMFRKYQHVYERDRKLFSARGYCQSSGDWDQDLHAVAVPLRSLPGEPPLAINCTLYARKDANPRLQKEVVPLLKQTAHELESLLGLRQ